MYFRFYFSLIKNILIKTILYYYNSKNNKLILTIKFIYLISIFNNFLKKYYLLYLSKIYSKCNNIDKLLLSTIII